MTQTSNRKWLSEIAIVLGLSLGASAVYSLLSLVIKLTSPEGLGGSHTTINNSYSDNQVIDLTYQLLGIGFGVVPALLALFLLSRDLPSDDQQGWLGNFFGKFNLTTWLRAVTLAAVIGIPGIGLYFAARAFGLAAKVIPTELGAYWWTIPVLILAAARAAFVEEVIVVGYLFDRLGRVGASKLQTNVIGAVIRGSYHLYQGFGGFIGNAVMGLAFGWAYQRWGRLLPLVIAHWIMDAVVFIGYAFVARLIP